MSNPNKRAYTRKEIEEAALSFYKYMPSAVFDLMEHLSSVTPESSLPSKEEETPFFEEVKNVLVDELFPKSSPTEVPEKECQCLCHKSKARPPYCKHCIGNHGGSAEKECVFSNDHSHCDTHNCGVISTISGNRCLSKINHAGQSNQECKHAKGFRLHEGGWKCWDCNIPMPGQELMKDCKHVYREDIARDGEKILRCTKCPHFRAWVPQLSPEYEMFLKGQSKTQASLPEAEEITKDDIDCIIEEHSLRALWGFNKAGMLKIIRIVNKLSKQEEK